MKRCISRIGNGLLLSAALAFGAAPAWGAAQYYDVVPGTADIDGGAGAWGAGNWKAAPGDTSGGAWVAGSDAHFNALVVGGPTAAITLAAPASANSLTFDGAGYSIGGASALTVTGPGAAGVGVYVLNADAAISAPLGGNLYVSGNGAATLTCSGGLSSTANRIVVGSGGSVIQDGGSVTTTTYMMVGRNDGTGGPALTGAGNYTINGGSLSVGAGIYLGWAAASNTGVFTQNGGTVQTLNDAQGIQLGIGGGHGTYNLNGGTLTSTFGTLGAPYTFQTFNFGGGTFTLRNNTASLSTMTTTIAATKRAYINTNGKTVTWAGPISGPLAAGLTQSGTGTLVLSVANTYGGNTTIENGTVRVGHATSLSSGSVTIVGPASTSSQLDLNGKTIANAVIIQFASIGPSATGCLANSDTVNTAVINGDIALGGNNYVGGAGNVTLNGLISGGVSGTGNDYAVYQQGAGTWTLVHPANTFDGWWYIVNGGMTVVTKLANLNEASSLGRATDATRNRVYFRSTGGTLKYAGSTASACDRGIVIDGTANVLDASGTDASAALTMTGAANAIAAGARTLTLTGSHAGVNTYQGIIGNGSGTSVALRKDGATTWALAGANSYTGATTVNAGTLQLRNGALTAQRTAVTLAGGTLENAAAAVNDLGTLVTTGSSTLVIGAGSALSFADSSALAGSWTGTLNIQGTLVDGVTLRVGTTGAGLAASQLNRISCNGGPVSITSAGYLVRESQGSWIAVQ